MEHQQYRGQRGQDFSFKGSIVTLTFLCWAQTTKQLGYHSSESFIKRLCQHIRYWIERSISVKRCSGKKWSFPSTEGHNVLIGADKWGLSSPKILAVVTICQGVVALIIEAWVIDSYHLKDMWVSHTEKKAEEKWALHNLTCFVITLLIIIIIIIIIQV